MWAYFTVIPTELHIAERCDEVFNSCCRCDLWVRCGWHVVTARRPKTSLIINIRPVFKTWLLLRVVFDVSVVHKTTRVRTSPQRSKTHRPESGCQEVGNLHHISKRILVFFVLRKRWISKWRNVLFTQQELYSCGDSWSYCSIHGPVLLNSGNRPEQLQTGQRRREWKTFHKSPVECSFISSPTPPSQTASSNKSRSRLHQAAETWPSKSWRNMQLWVSEVQKQKNKKKEMCEQVSSHFSWTEQALQGNRNRNSGGKKKRRWWPHDLFPLQV